MTMHLFGMILTHRAIFANNRGENEGNKNTLQKVIRDGDQYSTFSAESIRYAIRDGWQSLLESENPPKLNRRTPDHRSSEIEHPDFTNWWEFLDDDVMGYMHASKETLSRRGALEITRAISTIPWEGEVMVNFASPGSNPASKSADPIPYAIEVHHTRYQYGFALTPEALGRIGNTGKSKISVEEKRKRIRLVLEGFLNVRRVGGNHARYFSDYSPEVIVLRWTDDPAPRFLYCFEQDDYGGISLNSLLKCIRQGDINSTELVIGSICDVQGIEQFPPGVHVGGIKAAAKAILSRIEDKQLGA